MDDPQTDTISLTNLADCEGSGGRQRGGDTVLVANPTYHFEREWLAGRAGQTFTVEQLHDLSVVVHFGHITDFSNECVIHAMSVHGFTACRSRISEHVGQGFHGMSVQRFRAMSVQFVRQDNHGYR